MGCDGLHPSAASYAFDWLIVSRRLIAVRGAAVQLLSPKITWQKIFHLADTSKHD